MWDTWTGSSVGSGSRFAAKLIRAIREAGETDELRFDAAENRIIQIRDGKAVGVINLVNMYNAYRQTPRANARNDCELSSERQWVGTRNSRETSTPRAPT